MSQGATEDKMDELADYDSSDALSDRTKVGLELADKISGDHTSVDEEFYAHLREHFSDDEILDLGMTIAFFSGWQRFIEAFGIRPDAVASADQGGDERASASGGDDRIGTDAFGIRPDAKADTP